MADANRIDLKFLEDSKKIKQWIEGLPLASIQAAAERIFYTLQEVNKTAVPLRQHLEFLESAGPPVSLILDQLRKSCSDITFPIPAKTLRVAGFVQEMLEMLIVGYQTILRQLLSTPPAKGAEQVYSHLFQQVSHRIFFYSFLVLQSNALLDQPCRKTIWIRINRLYMRALKEDRHTKSIDFPGFKGYICSNIEQLYKKILLLSLIPLYSLRNEQVQELIASLDVWAEAMMISHCYPGANRKQMPFQVDPDKDSGPVSAGFGCDTCVQPHCLLIDTARIQALLTQLVMQAARLHEDKIALTNGTAITIKTLETLKGAWKERPKRNDRRDPIDAVVEIVISLGGIHHTLDALAKAPATPPQPLYQPQRQPSHNSIYDTGILSLGDNPSAPVRGPANAALGFPQDEEYDLDAILNRRQGDSHGHWQKQRDTSGYGFMHALQRDRSEHGCQLELRAGAEMKLRVGELVALRDDPEDSLRLGVIRWIKQREDDTINCGVLRLGESLRPAAVTLDGGGTKSEKITCLVARHVRNGKTMLVAPFMAGLRGKRLSLHYGRRQLPIAFTGWPIEHSRSFEAFEFGVPTHNANAPDPTVPLFTLELLDSLAEQADEGRTGGSPPKGIF